MKKLISIILLITSPTLLVAQNISVNAFFEPNNIPRGRATTYKVIVSGTQSAITPATPKVKGLTFTSQGSQKNIQMINGKTSIYTVNVYGVKASTPGEFIIPAYEIEAEGEKLTIPSAKLTVTTASAVPTTDTKEDVIHLAVTVDADNVYVGQYLPISVSIMARQNIGGNILNLPTQDNDAFSDHGYINNAPTELVKDINGSLHNTFTWQTFITPLKAGTQSLEYHVDMAIAIPSQKNTQRPSAHDLLSRRFSSVFDDIFSSSRAQPVELYSKPIALNVKSLPTAGKPDNFSGAIGDFNISEPTIDSTKLQVGEPLTLSFSIEGKGNFANITPPELNLPEEDWKTYSPKADFKPTNAFGFEGTKTFEYILIPQNEDITNTPEIEFTYFNPESGQYKERTISKKTITITPAPVTALPALPTTQPEVTLPSPTLPSAPELVPNKLKIKGTVDSLEPLFLKKWFYFIQLLPLLLIAYLYKVGKYKQRLREDKSYFLKIQKEQALERNLHSLRKAYSKKKPQEFYDASLNAVRDVVGFNLTSTPHSLTLDEVRIQLKEKDTPATTVADVEHLFNTADILKFSGSSASDTLSKDNLRHVENLIQELQKCD